MVDVLIGIPFCLGQRCAGNQSGAVCCGSRISYIIVFFQDRLADMFRFFTHDKNLLFRIVCLEKEVLFLYTKNSLEFPVYKNALCAKMRSSRRGSCCFAARSRAEIALLRNLFKHRKNTGKPQIFHKGVTIPTQALLIMSISKENRYQSKEVIDMWKKGAKFVALALTFGVLASVAFQGSNYVYNQSLSGDGKAETSSQTAETTADAVSTANTGEGAQEGVTAIAEASMPSIVAITNKSVQEMRNLFGQTQSYESESSGSGIIIGQTDEELLIVTNNHVVSSAQELSVGFVDETACEAKIKGTDASHDIAVIAVKMSDIPEETREQIKVIALGSSSELKVGEQVVAIGNALGYGQSVTTGIVSELNRQVTIDGNTYNLIQTDAAINPGNSGGALLNMSGQLVGINSAKLSDTSVEGMGYAIPVDDVLDIIEGLMNRTTRDEKAEEGEEGFLGISGQDVTTEVSKSYDMPKGVYITSVEEGSAADKAGLKKGYIITRFDGSSVSSISELKEQLSYYKAGESVEVVYSTVSGGEYTEQTVTVTLGKKPAE